MKPQLHQSSLAMLSRCGEAFRRRYIEGEKIPPGIALITGTAVHRSAALNLTHKLESGTLLPSEAVAENARDELARCWDEGVLLEAGESEEALKGEAIDQVTSLATLHAEHLAPHLDPAPEHDGVAAGVEWSWVLECAGYPYDLAGQVDVLEDRPGGLVVRDLKTRSKAPSKSEAETSLQLTLYSMAAKVHRKKAAPKVALDVLTKTKTPKLVTVEGERSDSDYEVFMRRFERSIEVIESGSFQPASPEDWVCSEKFCGYAPTCAFFKGKKQFTTGGTNGKS
jgi:hypothetical protein